MLEVDLPTLKPNSLHSVSAAIVLQKMYLLQSAGIHQQTWAAAAEEHLRVLYSLSVVLMHFERRQTRKMVSWYPAGLVFALLAEHQIWERLRLM